MLEKRSIISLVLISIKATSGCLLILGFGAVMTTVRHILKEKGYQVWSLGPESP